MKDNTWIQKVFRHYGEEDNEKWLASVGFQFPQANGLDWTTSADNRYTVDMSRYFNKISDELHIWLLKENPIAGRGITPMEWRDALEEESSAEPMGGAAGKKKQLLKKNDWLLGKGSKFNPMAKFLEESSEPSMWSKPASGIYRRDNSL